MRYAVAPSWQTPCPGVDAVVLARPGTPETDGLFDADLINALPAHAIVVNVGRGTTIDQDALIGAPPPPAVRCALEVCATEPPAPDNPLWDLDNVLLGPHTAALSAKENDRLVDLFLDT